MEDMCVCSTKLQLIQDTFKLYDLTVVQKKDIELERNISIPQRIDVEQSRQRFLGNKL